jgi:kynurenine formamidase
MPLLADVLAAVRAQAIEVIDLTAPLVATTPILVLPEPFANTIPFQREELSHYDERGPEWYWSNIHTGEQTGTHLDVSVRWVPGRGKGDVSQMPCHR